MFQEGGSMLQNLLFLQDPFGFLRLHLWRCQEGLNLSTRLEQAVGQGWRGENASDAHVESSSSSQIAEFFLDCYLHVQCCRRCIALERVGCEHGFLGTDLPNDASRNSMRTVLEASSSSERLAPSHQRRVTYWKGCEICAAKRSGLRALVWNIDAARSQKIDV